MCSLFKYFTESLLIHCQADRKQTRFTVQKQNSINRFPNCRKHTKQHQHQHIFKLNTKKKKTKGKEFNEMMLVRDIGNGGFNEL